MCFSQSFDAKSYHCATSRAQELIGFLKHTINRNSYINPHFILLTKSKPEPFATSFCALLECCRLSHSLNPLPPLGPDSSLLPRHFPSLLVQLSLIMPISALLGELESGPSEGRQCLSFCLLALWASRQTRMLRC